MRQDVSFESGGLTCRGWLYRPENAAGALPVVVMSHGVTAVIEQHLAGYAERFAREGYAVLVFVCSMMNVIGLTGGLSFSDGSRFSKCQRLM